MNPFDSRIVYAVGKISELTDGLFVSMNGGDSWSNFDSNGLSNSDIFELMIGPAGPDDFFLATSHGVFSFARDIPAGGPVIEQLLPASGAVGSAMSINGRDFKSSQGSSKIFFGDRDAGTAASWSDTSISATVPAGAQTGPVTVTVGSLQSNSFEFIVLPTAGFLLPDSGPSSGGTKVAIHIPSAFSKVQFNVLFGSTLAKVALVTFPSIVICITPPGQGSVDVVLSSSTIRTKIGTFHYQ